MKTEDIVEQGQELTEKAKDWQETAMQQARDAGEATQEYVRENAWTSLAVAAGIGCLLGFLLARARD